MKVGRRGFFGTFAASAVAAKAVAEKPQPVEKPKAQDCEVRAVRMHEPVTSQNWSRGLHPRILSNLQFGRREE